MSSRESDPTPSEGGLNPTPDLRIIFPEVKAGDETAIRVLHALTQTIISKKLGRYSDSKVDKDEIRCAVTEKMLLAEFDPNWPIPEDTQPNDEPLLILRRYGKYIAKTIRSVVTDKIDAKTMELSAAYDFVDQTTEQASTETRYTNGDGTAAIPDEVLEAVLTKPQLSVFRLRRMGITSTEVSEQLDIEILEVWNLMRKAILRLEEHVLKPAGLYRIEYATAATAFNPRMVRKAIQRGAVQAVKIYHRWYIKAEWLRQLGSPENTVLLGDIASTATICTFRRIYPERLILRNRRCYINVHDIALVKAIADAKKERKQQKIHPPEPGYISIGDIDCTASEARRLYAAMYDGTYSRVISRGRWRFVPEVQALALLERIRS